MRSEIFGRDIGVPDREIVFVAKKKFNNELTSTF